jgi:drug/metabolite transporter (DMT)-like permease
MSPWISAILCLGALCAAAGQVCFKLGATGRVALPEFLNTYIIVGLLLYVIGTLFWIAALSKAPLNAVYPFTALTFVLVLIFSAVVLREDLSLRALAGTVIVVVGLYFVYSGSSKV